MPGPLAALDPLLGVLEDGQRRAPWLPSPADVPRTIRLPRATDLRIPFAGYRAGGQPINLTDWLLQLTIRDSSDPESPALVARIGLPILGAPNNQKSFDIAASETATIPFGRRVYDIRGRYLGLWYVLVPAGVCWIEPSIGVPDEPLTAVSPVEFYVADPPLVASFDFSGTHILELGDSLINPTFAMSYNAYPGAPSAATLTDGTHTLNVTSPFTGPAVLPHTYAETAIGDQQDFTLTVSRPDAPDAVAVVSAFWQARVFWGVSPAGTYNAAFIHALSTSALQASRVAKPGYAAGLTDLCFYAIPTAFGGVPGDFVNDATGIAIGMTKVASAVSVTNSFSVTVNYDLWASNQPNLGALTIRVS